LNLVSDNSFIENKRINAMNIIGGRTTCGEYAKVFFGIMLSAVVFSALLTPLNLQANEIKYKEINVKECKRYINSMFDENPNTPENKYFNREIAVKDCINEMDDNYKKGLPSYATHTPRDIEIYREEKQKKSTLKFRAKNKDTLNRIKNSCAEPIFHMYVGMYTEKTKGASKKDQVKTLRSLLHSIEPNSILESIIAHISYVMLDEIYSSIGPTSDTEIPKRVISFYEKCTEIYEQALFLR
jgi:hypothetical protein